MATATSFTDEEWRDFSNALQFYKTVEQLHSLYNSTCEQDCIGQTNRLNNSNNKNSGNDNLSSFHYSETTNRTKPNMYSYDVVNYYENPEILNKKIIWLADEIMKSINHIYDVFRLCNENVFLCFNGGKDAVVTLHLFRCAYAKYLKDTNGKIEKPKLVYFKTENDEFPEVSQFLNESVFVFDFDLYVFDGTWEKGVINFMNEFHEHYKERINQEGGRVVDTVPDRGTGSGSSLGKLEKKNTYIPIVSFVMGTRVNDPYCEGLEILNISSKGLPPYLYLNPIFYWSYGAVWTFILYFKLDYCILYNHGYTSIGSTSDTIRNEYLKWNNCYLPAYFLKNWEHERFNRIIRKRI